MSKKSKKHHIHIGTEAQDKGFDRFIDAWHRADQGKIRQPEVHLNFEDLASLLSLLTPRRFEILKYLRRQGAMSVRSLSKALERDYKNVHSDVRALEDAGLIERNEEGEIQAPWDVIDAHFSLVA